MERGKGPNGDQFKRYSTLPNWILTDYLEFRWYAAGEKRLTVRVADLDGKGNSKPPDGGEKLAQLLTAFYDATRLDRRHRQGTRQPHGRHDAHDPGPDPCRFQTGDEETDASRKSGAGTIRAGSDFPWPVAARVAARLPGHAHPRSERKQFADMFAQTLAYGLFAARVHAPNRDRSRASPRPSICPSTNPFLRELFEQIAGVDMPDTIAWAVDDMVELLKSRRYGGDSARLRQMQGPGRPRCPLLRNLPCRLRSGHARNRAAFSTPRNRPSATSSARLTGS